VPEIVSNEELPSASILSGLQLNISGIIGPALGGLLSEFLIRQTRDAEASRALTLRTGIAVFV
jgi:Transmembrane secretion effector